MPLDHAKLHDLKDLLQATTEFSSVWKFFLDHFGEDPAFHAQGELVRDPFLEFVFDRMARQVFGGPIDLAHVRLTRVAEAGLVHGGGVFGRSILNVLYFEDIEMGMFMAIKSFGESETVYGRMRRGDFVDMYKPSAN